MASGKKNYFRHSFHARKHPDIVGLIEDHGKEAYFHFFALAEVCAEKASDQLNPDWKFIFRRSTLCRELLVTNSRLVRHLVAMTPSLVDQVVATEKEVQILFPKLSKYMGWYESKLDSKTSNKTKLSEIKQNEIKLNTENKTEAKKILSKVEPVEALKKPSPLSFLFDQKPEVQDWLNAGTHETHLMLVKKFSHHVLVELIESAYLWAQPKSVRAEAWLLTFVSSKDTHGLGANQAKKAFSKKTHGLAPTTENPTGNPYIQEAIDKGLIA